MFAYLLQVTLCLAVFYGPYAAFLRKETFFAINRWYLLGTLGLSVCAPLLLLLPEDFFFTKHNSTLMYTLEPITVGIQEVRNSLTPSASDSIWMIIALSVYWIGVILLVFRFAMNLRSILKLYQHGEHVKGRHRIIYSSHPHQPFSFFHWIFLSKDHGLNPEELEEVLTHESVHAAAWHSLDVLFTELARTILWPSPLIYLYHKSLRRVHEYLADAEVLRHSTLKNYGQLLFSQATSGIQFALVHHFFQSHLKNRIFMMTKHKSNRIALVKYVSLLPIAILIMAIFAFRDSADRASQYDISGWFVHDSIPSQVYKVVDEMPRFPGCEDSGLISEELNQCALQKMLEHVYAQIKYPKEARDLGVSGRVIVQFVVRKDGSVSDVQVIKSIGHGTDEVVLEVVKSMPRWRPGINEGKVVDVEFTLPIAFKLDGQANQEM
ncbi:MAG TPA: M56 family metallopeptidase, partial [Saprospiraceae bacterium]|nr:M56 family metallopeptidase [Saprospiraceae bacterium]